MREGLLHESAQVGTSCYCEEPSILQFGLFWLARETEQVCPLRKRTDDSVGSGAVQG